MRPRPRSKPTWPQSPTRRFDDTPDGKDENDNIELRRWGVPPPRSTGSTSQEGAF